MAQPLLALIRYSDPAGTIDVLAAPHIGPVFQAMAEVGDVLLADYVHGKLQLSDRLALARRLRKLRYERCFVLPNSLKSALAPWMAGIPYRVGHRGESRYWLINRAHEPVGSANMPMVEHYARLAFAPQQPIHGRG